MIDFFKTSVQDITYFVNLIFFSYLNWTDNQTDNQYSTVLVSGRNVDILISCDFVADKH